MHRIYPANILFRSFPAIIIATATPAFGQANSSAEEITVYGELSPLGIPAERTLSEDEIASYGLSTIDGLLAQIARERGDVGEPVFLVNGKRVTGIGDIGAYPVEAIQQLQILPLGSAGRVGASANRRVVNIVLKPKIRTFVAEGRQNLTTEGSGGTLNAELSATDIRRPRRVNLSLRARRDNPIRESDRDVVQASVDLSDLGEFRTLRPGTELLDFRASAADQLTPSLNGSIVGRLFQSETLALLGRDDAGIGLDQRSRRRGGSADLQLNADAANWLLAFTGTFGFEHRLTRTRRNSGLFPAIQDARTTRAGAELNATGSLINLPAGPVSLSLRARLNRDAIAAASSRFVRRSHEFGASVQVPIASAAGGPLRGVGEFSIGLDLFGSRVTGVGQLSNATYSFQWQPADGVRLTGSRTSGRSPPGFDLLAGTRIETPGIRYFDPLRSETVNILEITGGNPDLKAQRGRDQRLSLSFKPFGTFPLLISAEYWDLRNRDSLALLPAANEVLLLALPDRFSRDAQGNLIRVDARSINFARESEQRLRQGLELSLPLGGSNSAVSPDSGQLQISVSHSALLKNKIVIRPGFRAVDLLSRDAFGLGGATRPRHELDFTVGYSARGLGLRVMGQHRSVSFLSIGEGTSTDALRFSPLSTVSFRVFVNGVRIAPSSKWLKGARISLSVGNIGNARQIARSETGLTPQRYQAAFNDPVGRTMQLEVRKTF